MTALSPQGEPEAGDPRMLMLGKGWFPDEVGGLDRYFRDLLEHLPEARGIVIGEARSAPARVRGVCAHDRPLASRLLAFWTAAQRAAGATDVVDAHFALYALLALRVGRLRRTPVVLHFQGPWADENVAAGDRSAMRQGARRLLERATYARADQAIVLTSAFRQVLVERYGVLPWKIHVEPPGVDLGRFSLGSIADAREHLGLTGDAFVAVSVRRLVPRMGLDILLDAWKGALERLPRDSTLLLVGDGPLREGLAARIAQLGLEDSVRLLGRIADDDLLEIYRAADVGVVPTLEHEGFGLVVIEAAACGTPSIVTAVGGLPEAVAGLDPSLVIPPSDASALADRLVHARADRPDRAACRAHAEGFDWSAVTARHRSIARRASGADAADERLKVVYLDHVARMSGGEIALLRLLPHLHDVHAHVILAEDGPLVEQLHLAGISSEVMAFGMVARDLRKEDVGLGGISPGVAAATAAYILRLAWRLRRLRPDLVHANSLKSGIYGSAAARLAQVPMIWHVRDRIAPDYLPRPAIRLVRAATRHLASAVVANSATTMATLGPHTNMRVQHAVVPDAIGPVRQRIRESGGPTRYGVVGRLAPWKGQDLFLRAFARAFPRGSERAVVIGGALFGEDDYARSLPTLAASLGIAERVEFRGHRADVWHELSRLDVLVHTSISPEPFGQVILEGMVAGIPVIAARAGGPAEILEHLRTGLLYKPNDAGALAESMLSLLDEQLRERLRAAAREDVRRYEPAIVAAEIQQLYRAVTSR